ncbi:MAG: YitT family protein [Clostridiales bacterium]|nr:YitT family protein [Clostridiales bacterium]MBQ5954662.1 YitT family protein [Bacillota bacterium]MBR3375267.1 YitT family protein [Bacillota bacterium]
MKLSGKERAKNILIMVFSNFLFAVSVTGFIRPHGIILGGATGLGLLITHYVNMKLSVVVMIINVVLLLIAYITMGKKFALSTLANSILYPAMMYVFETFITLGKVTEDPMLSCVFGGVLMGIGIGMILKTGGSTGGTDVIAVAINKYTHVNLSALLYLVDGVIMACQLMFSNREQVLLGIFLMALLTLTMNKIMIMGKTQAELMIFSDKTEEIKERILGQEDAGATLFHIQKGYSGKEGDAIMCIIPRRKVYDMCEMIQEVDPTAFWTISEVNEIYGRGFSFERRA